MFKMTSVLCASRYTQRSARIISSNPCKYCTLFKMRKHPAVKRLSWHWTPGSPTSDPTMLSVFLYLFVHVYVYMCIYTHSHHTHAHTLTFIQMLSKRFWTEIQNIVNRRILWEGMKLDCRLLILLHTSLIIGILQNKYALFLYLKKQVIDFAVHAPTRHAYWMIERYEKLMLFFFSFVFGKVSNKNGRNKRA
mgnify:CR=1 FL=1